MVVTGISSGRYKWHTDRTEQANERAEVGLIIIVVPIYLGIQYVHVPGGILTLTLTE